MRLIDRRMAFRLFNRSEPTEFTQRRDGSSHGVSLNRAAPNSLTGPVASASADATVTPKHDVLETSPCRRDGHSKSTARSPEGDGFRWRFGEGIESLGRRCFQFPPHRLS
jgi:hypothetical protein